uniref:Uncharacterized protein n=1 Tax=Arundo donax TaxID=35708 RepID=A0A0A8XQ07_ARUDO
MTSAIFFLSIIHTNNLFVL